MTRLLHVILGRLPIGWLQLTHNRARLIAAVAGIAFANLLVFVQLGVVASMNGVVQMSYSPFRADIMVSPESPTLFTGTLLPRRIMYLLLADPDVSDAALLYLDNLEWKRPNGVSMMLTVYGMAPEAAGFASQTVAPQLATLALQDRVLLDDQIRNVDPSLRQASPDKPMTFEINGHTVSVIGNFKLGSGFGSDGALFVSDQTFLNLSPQRTMGTPSHILVDVKPGEDPATIAARLNGRLSSEHVQVRTMAQAIAADVNYMNTQVPMGIIFGIGVFIGIFVGLVIVYQVLATDVAAHLKEYATFKAMGYPHRFLLGVVFEEALIIAFMGFVPGVALGTGIYSLMAAATDLPLGMTVGRAVAVFLGTFAACSISGALATLRLRGADPAELFG
ncbi:ABC transporter permease DevC [Agrobacterium vitis]|uniref:ABC transporter permease DevC n=1 Tax=Agrobacterium vitis TaxID=373 RepID=UPI002AC91E04|nr:ABC transporter permease DevC [Agrobacterium vitis]MCM2450251.1 FtsX-like permease family protein [Agrobacterium vitis]